MCSTIITRNIFIVNAVHTVLQDLLLPPRSTKIVSFYNWYFKYSCIKFTWTQKKFTWTRINFAWTRVNFAWTRMKVDQNFRVCSRYLGHVTSVWNRHPNFCGSVWRPYYSTQNMWSSFTSIIITYTVASTFMPQPLLWKSAIFAMNKYICLWQEKG